MMTNRHDKPDESTRRHPTTGDVERPRARRRPSGSAVYHPTSMLRELLSRSARVRKSVGSAPAESSPRLATETGTRALRFAPFVALASLLGVVSGFVEVAALQIQANVQGHIGWHSLMVSRHITWMVPMAAPLVIVPLAVVLVWPVLGLLAMRSKRGRLSPTTAATLAWGWAGAVLGTLLFLGPITAMRAFHSPAAFTLSIGIGFRVRHWLVRPIVGRPRLTFWAAGIAIVALPACLVTQWNAVARRQGPVPAHPLDNRPNLLWIVADTLSAEHMSLYGYDRQTTPELGAWAEEGITFDLASSAAPWTLPSHITMFTGLWPFEHDARVDRAYRGSSPTIAEHLRAQGYQTAGIAANVRMCNSAYGVGRGFDHYIDYPGNNEISLKAMMYNSALGGMVMRLGRRIALPIAEPFPFDYEPTAREVTADASAWLDRVSPDTSSEKFGWRRPFFLFLNFMDVHGPYQPTPHVASRFWTGPTPAKELATPGRGWDALHARDAARPEHREQRQRELEDVSRRLIDLYDQCIYGLDAELGRFLRELRAAGRLANTWVVITADHGEHFGEHNHFGHGSSLYNEQTHVPLVLIPPLGPDETGPHSRAQLRGRRVTVPVSLRDLPRTMTELLAGNDKNPFPGRSLAQFWSESGPVVADPVLAQLEEPRLSGDDFSTDQAILMNSVIDENYILIDSRARPPELFAIDDRKQQRNLARDPAQQSRLDRMRRALAALRRAPAHP